jgi:hypothetical protein
MDSGGHLEPGAEFNAMALAQEWAGLCDPTLAFRRPELAAMAAFWRQTAGDAPVPRRADMKVSSLKAHLPHVVIYERIVVGSARRYRVRLMGTQFAQVMGDLTGKFIDEAIAPQFLSRWNAALDAVLDAGVPLRFISRSDTANKSFLVGEFFEAPLLSDGGSMNLVIAAGIFTPADNWRSFLKGSRASVGEISGVAV